MALDFLAGCLGGCAGVLVGHPFDTVKVHLQTQDHKRPIYRGTYHCLKTIVAKDSMRGLYRGMSSPMAGVAFVNAIVFGVYGNVQRRTKDPNSLFSHFVAGSAAGLAQSIVCSPMELVKTRLQLQSNMPSGNGVKFKNPYECLRYIQRTEGVRGVFRGLGITALRDLPGFSTYFISYELLTGSNPNLSVFHTLMAGGLAGTISWAFTFPIDVVKSRLQADGMSGQRQYTGIVDCIRKSYRAEGLHFFSRGLASTLIRAFPMNAACFLVVSWVLRLSTINQTSSCHQVDYIQPESVDILGSITASNVRSSKKQPDYSHQPFHKALTIRSFVVIGAFNEAICATELAELANEMYEDKCNYYKWNIDEDDETESANSTQPKSLTYELLSD